MYKNILIATDGSELAEKAVREGINVAKGLGAKVILFTASPAFRLFETDSSMFGVKATAYKEACERRAGEDLARGEKVAKSAGVECETLHSYGDHPYKSIIQAARKNGCDLVVMASHGRKGVAGVLLGSETAKVLTHSKIPVLVCR